MTALDFYKNRLKDRGFSEKQIKDLTNHKDLPWLQFAEDYHTKQLILSGVSNCKRDETLELLEEIMTKVKEADSEVENGIYDPMLECAKHILNNYKIERR